MITFLPWTLSKGAGVIATQKSLFVKAYSHHIHVVTLYMYLLVLQLLLLRNLQAPCKEYKLKLPLFMSLGTDPIATNYLE